MSIRKPAKAKARKKGDSGLPPVTLEEALEIFEPEKVLEEVRAFNKRRNQLSRKLKNWTITKKEESELNRLFGKEGDAMSDKLFATYMLMTGAVVLPSRSRTNADLKKKKKRTAK